MKLHVLIDSVEYIQTNCFQHQLFKTLQNETELSISTINDIKNGKKLPKTDKILSCLKLRTLFNNIDVIKKFLEDSEVYIYEQDPWESFKDDASFKGSYEKIYEKLNVRYFLNTSKWWSDFINQAGLRSKFVKMWVLPEYCSSRPLWKEREINVGFCGSLHPYRKKLFSYLEDNGIKVEILPTGDYYSFLRNLSKIKIFIHNEEVNWELGGKQISANSLWIKDVEAAARGCISIRNYDEEFNNYVDTSIQTIKTFSSFKSSVELIENILSLDNQALIESSVGFISSKNEWKTIIEAIGQ
jgi:hypothetical protein